MIMNAFPQKNSNLYHPIEDEADSKVFELSTNDVQKSEALLFNRDWWNDEKYGPVEKTLLAKFWEIGRWVLLAVLTFLPFGIYSLNELSNAWLTSLMGLLACCLPSGGAPVAGGIVFIPGLQMLGLKPKQCVAFCSAAQALGCGAFAPLNWVSRDPGIFIKTTFPICLPASLVGLLLSLFVIPIQENEVSLFFTIFCVFLAFNIINGLQLDLTTQDEPIRFERPKSFRTLMIWLAYIFFSLLGGMITGYIGIGIEKIYFLLTTSLHKAEVKRSTVTAISIVGWLSFLSALIHFFILKDVPIVYWLCSLPGILLGSIIGPHVNSFIGSRNVMIVFCAFLFLNVVFELSKR